MIFNADKSWVREGLILGAIWGMGAMLLIPELGKYYFALLIWTVMAIAIIVWRDKKEKIERENVVIMLRARGVDAAEEEAT